MKVFFQKTPILWQKFESINNVPHNKYKTDLYFLQNFQSNMTVCLFCKSCQPNHIFLTIFEFFFCLVLFFMILKKLSTFKFFLKIATFFKKSQSLKNKHVRSLIHLSLVAQLISFFYLKKRQSFIGLWNQLKENVGNSNFALLNQKNT